MIDNNNFRFVLDELARMQKQINDIVVELHKSDVFDTETAKRLIGITNEEKET